MGERRGDIGMINISMMEKTINSMQKKYSRYVKSSQRKKKREQDVHLTPKDERILIESLVISNLINLGVRRIFIGI
jgi:hypothetical protein